MIYLNLDFDLSTRLNINMPLLFRLHEDTRRPTDGYFDYSSRLEN
jgi:hypothetical protein